MSESGKTKELTMTQKYTVLNMAAGKYDFEVHAADCTDIAKKRRFTNGQWDVEAESAEQVVTWELEEMEAQDQHWPREAFHVQDCATMNVPVPQMPVEDPQPEKPQVFTMDDLLRMDDDDARALWSLCNDIKSGERRIVQLTAQIEETAGKVAKYVAEGLNLNSLGEMQGLGSRLDIEIALRQERWANLSKRSFDLGIEVDMQAS